MSCGRSLKKGEERRAGRGWRRPVDIRLSAQRLVFPGQFQHWQMDARDMQGHDNQG
jgi:hypothetical protein